jgi:molybdenum-dependent DNA-binding transcriptional regulator ModE
MDIEKILKDIVSDLKSRGFDKHAAVVAEVEAGWTPGGFKGTPYQMRSPQPTPIGTPGFHTGDVYIELTPLNEKKEEMRRWDFPEEGPYTMDQMIFGIKKGFFAVDNIAKELQKAQSPVLKRQMQMLLNLAEETTGQKAITRLASLAKTLTEKGYDTLGRRLMQAVDSASMQIRHLLEKHEAPSLELLYEKSGSAKKFEESVQKLMSIYDNVGKIIKNFDREYLDQIMHPLDRKEIGEEEATKKTLKMVRDTDASVDAKFREISKSL